MKRLLLAGSATALVLALTLGAVSSTPAYAATAITVTTTSDAAVTDGQCSLREAIQNANAGADTTGGDCAAGGAGGDAIGLSSLSGTITLGSDLPVISHDLTINGPGANTLAIDANGNDYAFSVGSVQATIAGLTMTGAATEGGLVTVGTTTVERSTIDGNTQSAGFNFGGGMSNDGGTLTVQDSTISDNRSLDSVFFGFGFGGGITNDSGTVSLVNSVVTGNRTRFGGGIENRGTLNLEGSTVSQNSTSNDSGGIRNEGTGTIEDSTISGNTAGIDFGGGITNGGTLTVQGSTISGNSILNSGSGGAIWNGQGATLNVSDSTVSGNSSFVEAGIDNYFGSATVISSTITANSGFGASGVSGGVVLENTIVADQTLGADCGQAGPDGGYNLDDDGTCGLSSVNHSLSNTNPLLDPAGLQDNGGPTHTIGLEPSSPAIDAIPLGANGCGTTITTDQRGISRPQGAGCDIGAFELVPPPADLSIAKSGAPNPVVSGNRLTYTLTLTNHGPGDATRVSVTDRLPSNVKFNSVASRQGDCTRSATGPKGGTISCSLGKLANGDSTGITIVVTTTTPGTLTNTATVSENGPDPNPLNNSATATTTVIGT